ncbi:hypothetical protein [Bradyrhizobium australiense]|uniref:Uncharacterized protein n=1 Tax=Bradyrhizobium australiense TaxID=2721161 RepID=A0A7Y4LZH5_9BRAD|nr:hypothetical protein [Bradyrhizobium australiense]
MRRTSWIDQRINDAVAMYRFLPEFGVSFFGRRIGAMSDRGHHEGEHHQGDVAMPPMPGLRVCARAVPVRKRRHGVIVGINIEDKCGRGSTAEVAHTFYGDLSAMPGSGRAFTKHSNALGFDVCDSETSMPYHRSDSERMDLCFDNPPA